jgi:hypothetical protein
MTSNEETAGPSSSVPSDPPVWQPPAFGDEPAVPDADPAVPPADAAAAPAHGAAPSPTGDASDVPADDETFGAPADDRERLVRRRPARAPARRGGSTTILLMLSALIAVGGVGFAIGHATGGSSTDTQTGNAGLNGGGNAPGGSFDPGQLRPDASGAPDFRGAGLGVGTISGTVVSVTADSMTVQLADGQTVTVSLGSSTTYHSQTSATSSAVTTGSTVVIQTENGAGTGGSEGDAAGSGTGRTATDVTVTSN